MGVQTKKNLHQAHVGQSVPVRLPWSFTTDGTTDPSVFSETVESVTRVTSDGGVALYRVRLAEYWALSDASTVWLSPTVRGPEAAIHYARYATGALVSTVAADPIREFDVAVTLLTVAPAVSQVNNVAAGAMVAGEVIVDQAAG